MGTGYKLNILKTFKSRKDAFNLRPGSGRGGIIQYCFLLYFSMLRRSFMKDSSRPSKDFHRHSEKFYTSIICCMRAEDKVVK